MTQFLKRKNYGVKTLDLVAFFNHYCVSKLKNAVLSLKVPASEFSIFVSGFLVFYWSCYVMLLPLDRPTFTLKNIWWYKQGFVVPYSMLCYCLSTARPWLRVEVNRRAADWISFKRSVMRLIPSHVEDGEELLIWRTPSFLCYLYIYTFCFINWLFVSSFHPSVNHDLTHEKFIYAKRSARMWRRWKVYLR